MRPEQRLEAVGARIRGQFAPAYLTLTSIIRWVAPTTLVGRVEATYALFDKAGWLLPAATLLTFLTIRLEGDMRARSPPRPRSAARPSRIQIRNTSDIYWTCTYRGRYEGHVAWRGWYALCGIAGIARIARAEASSFGGHPPSMSAHAR
jgi:hypothetical protein